MHRVALHPLLKTELEFSNAKSSEAISQDKTLTFAGASDYFNVVHWTIWPSSIIIKSFFVGS